MVPADLCFFFFKQKTAYEMRISDWSSDVCSSDLYRVARAGRESQLLRGHHVESGGVFRGVGRKGKALAMGQALYLYVDHRSSPDAIFASSASRPGPRVANRNPRKIRIRDRQSVV